MTTAREAFKRELDQYLRARYPLVQIVTHEEDRAIETIAELAEERGKSLFVWSASRGIVEHGKTQQSGHGTGLQDLAAALAYIDKAAREQKDALFLLLDPAPWLNTAGANPLFRRRLRDLAVNIRTRGYGATCLIVTPTAQVPVELEKEVTLVDFPLPDRAEIAAFIGDFVQRIHDVKFAAAGDPAALIEALVDASLGLTMLEIENALAKAIVDDGKLGFDDVDWIVAQKRQLIRKSGVLDFYDAHGLTLGEIGGLDSLKQWLAGRSAAFSPGAQSFGIQVPKGVLLTGVPGCGKSLAAKCVAASWRLPLIRFDVGKVYSSLVGSSEEHMRQAIATCEAVAPCVLWVDEIEKALPRNTGHIGDSGVSLRILGSFLTWLEEKSAPVFVFATANQISLLPPELLRKGRFDEVFFVDLPDDAERREIIAIHLRHARRNVEDFDLDRLTALTGPDTLGPGVAMTGAEIAAWVNEAMIHAYTRVGDKPEKAALTEADLAAVAGSFVPIARLRREETEEMRSWAATHALRPASNRRDPEGGRRGRVVDLDTAGRVGG